MARAVEKGAQAARQPNAETYVSQTNGEPSADQLMTDADARWTILEQGVERVMTRLTEGIDMPTYMRLYTAVHDFCTQQKVASTTPVSITTPTHQRGGKSCSPGWNTLLRNQSHDTVPLTQSQIAHLLGEELYNHLIAYLKSHLRGVHTAAKTHSDDALLSYYIREWNRYTTAAQFVNHLFRYLNRHWVKREMDEGKKNIYDVYTLHLVRWKDDMFIATQSDVMRAVLRLVERQRNGETIEYQQIKSIVGSFVALGIDETDCSKPNLEIYQTYFEEPFLRETRSYYQRESSQFLAENSVIEYMKKADARITEEAKNVPLYLLPEITAPLTKTCCTTLIADHAEILQEEFQSLLDNHRIEDLGRMYRLLQKIDGGLDPLRTRFENHVNASGKATTAKVSSESGEKLEAKAYVTALLDVHTQYSDLVQKAFVGESEFVRSLDSACRQFVNNNQVCENNSNRSPELLAKYTDELLKKSAQNAEEEDMETSLSQIMTIFKYIDDKDVFLKFYSKNLARRLVQTLSISDDAETNMISKLKEACGFEYTNKLQRMFQDMQISKDLNTNFRDYQDTTLGLDKKEIVDASYNILGTGFWPLNPPNTPFTPPQAIIKTYERFQNFYTSKHSGRKLTWLWQLCKGEVRANYTKSPQNKMPFTFQVSTYQIAILLLFNDAPNDTVTYDEMVASTSLAKPTLDPSIAILLKARVLTTIPEDAKPDSGTSFKLNHGFKHKKLKVNLNIAIKSETKAEVEETHKSVDEDRKLVIQSAIVRIMKSRHTMKHGALTAEAIGQVSMRFKPSVADIKKSIDTLIDKEYLERLDDGNLGYLA
ncbi:MAG: hypothetical protein M1828_001173 [Chrysothrix sp. TS-e1954]|nr:MAG: hypothetical protein M1828_001173 [Chrysothrix sp. TS-e1954]